MILVKSLIVILIMLILAQFAIPILEFLSKLFDGREGFAEYAEEAEEETIEAEEAEEEAGEFAFEESSYSQPSLLENHEKVANDSKIVADLQDKMNELNQLSEKATEINNQLDFNNI